MVKLRDIMTTDPVTLNPEMTIREAMDLLTTEHVTGAPVVAGGTIVGVLSATDLLTFVASLGDLTDGHLADGPTMMPGQDEPTGWDDENEPSAKFFSTLWAGVLPSASLPSEIGLPEWNPLDEHTVAEAMTHAPIHAMPPDAAIDAAADRMRRARVHRLLVVEGSKLVGIVTSMDIVRAVASHLLTRSTR